MFSIFNAKVSFFHEKLFEVSLVLMLAGIHFISIERDLLIIKTDVM
jgi:hypothetical protein